MLTSNALHEKNPKPHNKKNPHQTKKIQNQNQVKQKHPHKTLQNNCQFPFPPSSLTPSIHEVI